MNEYLPSLQTYWESLNQRERWMGCIGATVAILYLLYICIGSPISNAIQAQQQELQDKKETWQWIQQLQSQHSLQMQHPLQTVDASTLLSLLAKEFSKSPLQNFKYTMQQASTDSIQVHFEVIPYPVFMQWLYSFSRQYQFIIQSLQIEHIHMDPGLVKLTIHLSTGNGNK